MPVEVMPSDPRDLFGRVAFETALQQLPVAPGTAVQQAVKFNFLQIHPVGRFHAFHGAGLWTGISL